MVFLLPGNKQLSHQPAPQTARKAKKEKKMNKSVCCITTFLLVLIAATAHANVIASFHGQAVNHFGAITTTGNETYQQIWQTSNRTGAIILLAQQRIECPPPDEGPCQCPYGPNNSGGCICPNNVPNGCSILQTPSAAVSPSQTTKVNQISNRSSQKAAPNDNTQRPPAKRK